MMFVRHAVLSAAVALMPSEAATAQSTITQMGPAKTAPALTPSLYDRGRPVKMIVTVALPPLPDAWVTLEQRLRWTVSRTMPADLPGTPPSLFVQRRGRDRFGECAGFTDRIDLTAIRAHGFRLVGTSYTPYPLSNAAPPQATIARLDAAGQVLPAGRNADAVTLLVTPLAGNPATPGGQPSLYCSSGYRFIVVVQGPRGVDPMTGVRTGG